jgi:O-methyltransferase
MRVPKLLRSLRYIQNSTYSEDGITTTHVADFLEDSRFKAAYLKGEQTGSWNGSQLRWRVYICCWAAQHALALTGDFVECGVNRGGISRAVMEYIGFDHIDRNFFLLDTFCGDPDVAAINRNDYSECYSDVVKTFATFRNVHIIRGRVPETLATVSADRVAYLSIDMNSAEPEIAALRFFWPKLVHGAAVILDDYAFAEDYRSQKWAMDTLGEELGFSVLSFPTGQGMILKS